MENPEKQEIRRNSDGRFTKGFSGNLKGRPVGKTLKEWVKDKLQKMNDKERNEFLMGLPKNIIWEMAEGKAQTDITSGGEKINPIPIINVHTNNSDKQDTGNEAEDKNSAGGDISEQDGKHNNILDSVSPERQE